MVLAMASLESYRQQNPEQEEREEPGLSFAKAALRRM